VVLAGPQERPNHHMTVIETPMDDGTPYPVKNGGWMSQPVAYEPGRTITMIAQDQDGRELFRLEAVLEEGSDGRLRPTFGPDWSVYAPITE
jgi:hypothetical protein